MITEEEGKIAVKLARKASPILQKREPESSLRACQKYLMRNREYL